MLFASRTRTMRLPIPQTVFVLLLAAFAVVADAAGADFGLSGPDGRRILLKDDGTWQYLQDSGAVAGSAKPEGEAVIVLERMGQRTDGCRIAVRLENKLPYEIRSLIPY